MYDLIYYLHFIFPFLTLSLLILGWLIPKPNYIYIALWLSLITCILHYQTANGEILGTYFDYKQASVYTMNLLVLVSSSIYLFVYNSLEKTRFFIKLLSGFLCSFLLIGSILLLTNIWINAYFLSHRKLNTPILQVAILKSLSYCGYKYIFYKVDINGHIIYMCPNHYGLIPSLGKLKNFDQELPSTLQNKFKGGNYNGIKLLSCAFFGNMGQNFKN